MENEHQVVTVKVLTLLHLISISSNQGLILYHGDGKQQNTGQLKTIGARSYVKRYPNNAIQQP